MASSIIEPKSFIRLLPSSIGIAILAVSLFPEISHADESGVSYWLPGRFSSLAATPQVPGWSMAEVYYHTSVSAFGNLAAAREIQVGRIPANINVDLNLRLNAQADLVLLNPTYTFATPVLGGQLAIGVTGLFGRSAATIDGTLTAAVGPFAVTRMGSIGDSITSVGDLYPQATLKWNAGVHNFMTYLTGDIPVGAYSPTRLANLGIGHAAIDGGGGYTYFNPQAGHEFSVVGGFTYNFKNQDTQYQNGIDFHVDWGASQFLSKQIFVGLVGYAYQQITDDFGQHPILGGFRSRVLGVGPQIGYLFPVGDMQGYLNLKGYGEFANENRPAGWNTWLTFSISPMAPSAGAPIRRMVTK
ncbi:SphA family protein [Bradyrhizobium australiense]|uniref:Phenol degradation protein meta n=1 Tax=Bradyrhizobium australiense TaxID=2721161 RepID=A0A7Y4GQ90_9BRAD|nr:transporter [Bradyrhizobium australiense]NOJ39993.1 phenol degradation protein meta [Bradyrhizobium australiense]